MRSKFIKRISAMLVSAVIVCLTCTSPAFAATNKRIFFGAGIKFENEPDRDWWVNNLSSVEIPAIVKAKNYAGSENYNTISANDAFDILENRAGIFAVHTHGNRKRVTFSNGTYFSDFNFRSLSSNALKDVDLVVYGTCNAAEGGATAINLATCTYDAGAKAVIGFEGATKVPQMNQWLFDFFKSYSKGKDITQSAKDGLFWAKFWNGGDAGATDTVVICER